MRAVRPWSWTILLLAGVLVACTAEPRTCPEPTGQYRFDIVETSGTCGSKRGFVSTIPSEPRIDCLGEWEISEGQCSYDLTRDCFAIIGTIVNLDFAGDGAYEGTISLDDFTSGECHSIYDVSLTPTLDPIDPAPSLPTL